MDKQPNMITATLSDYEKEARQRAHESMLQCENKADAQRFLANITRGACVCVSDDTAINVIRRYVNAFNAIWGNEK